MLDLLPLAEARTTAPLVAISMARTSDRGETPHRGRAKGNPFISFMSGGWAPVRAEHTNDDLVVTAGAIPAGRSGSFVRTGPNPQSYHFFAGDAMSGKALWRTRPLMHGLERSPWFDLKQIVVPHSQIRTAQITLPTSPSALVSPAARPRQPQRPPLQPRPPAGPRPASRAEPP